MKLIFCPECMDVFRLYAHEWRMCRCGQSGGKYTKDPNAEIGGKAKVFGVANPFFQPDYLELIRNPPEDITLELALRKFREEQGYGDQLSDCWWGEFEGDEQIERLPEADPYGTGKYVHANSNRFVWAIGVLLGLVNFSKMQRDLEYANMDRDDAVQNDYALRKACNDIEWLKRRIADLKKEQKDNKPNVKDVKDLKDAIAKEIQKEQRSR